MISLFGYPKVTIENEEIRFKRRKSLALLAYLVVSEEPRSREYLANLLWPSLSERSAAQNLRNILSDIRLNAAGDFLNVDSEQVSLDPSAPSDIAGFGSVARLIDDLPPSRQILPPGLVAKMDQAIQLYGRGFLAGFRIGDSEEFDDWQYLHAQRFQQSAIRILAALARHDLALQRLEHGEQVLRTWLMLDPVSEEAHRLLMILHQQNGSPDEALHLYQSLARLLQRQEGTTPEAETRALYERIRSASARSTQNALLRPSARNILPAEPPRLFGRDTDLNTLKQWLIAGDGAERRSPAVTYGEPGVGKSALAATLAYDADIRAAFPDGVLWATLGPWPDHDATLRLWTSALEVQELRDVRAVEHRAMHLGSALYDARVLLILDDVWSLYDGRLLALGKRGSAVLMTTRFPSLAQQIAHQPDHIYALGPLGEQASLALLAKRAPALVNHFPEAAHKVVRCYRGVPLVLNVLAQTFNQYRLMGDNAADSLMEPFRLLDQPIAPDQLTSREPLSLRAIVEGLWQRLPEAARAATVEIIRHNRRPYLLDLARVSRQETDGLVDILMNSGLVYRKQHRLRLNPFLVALLLSDKAVETGH
jgi:DNA-binding SARP family transcriptional activator